MSETRVWQDAVLVDLHRVIDENAMLKEQKEQLDKDNKALRDTLTTYKRWYEKTRKELEALRERIGIKTERSIEDNLSREAEDSQS